MVEPNENLPTENANTCSTGACCNYMRVARGVIGALLLTVMLGNLIVYASPEWTATIGSYLGTGACSTNSCAEGKCCPGLTSIGMPASVFDAVKPADTDAPLPDEGPSQP